MKLPKLFKKRLEQQEARKEDFRAFVDRQAHAHEISSGTPTLGVAISLHLTDAEQALFPKAMTPYCRVDWGSDLKLFGFSHFKKGDDFFELVKKGENDPGVVMFIFNRDGSPWPEEDNQTFVELDCSPAALWSGETGPSIISQLVLNLFSMPVSPSSRETHQTQEGEAEA